MKIFRLLFLSASIFSAASFVPVHAAEYCPEDGGDCYEVEELSDVASESSGQSASTWDASASEKKAEGEGSFVYVTEKIPGANCSVHKTGDNTKRLYKCTVGEGFSTITGMLGSLIKYATYLTGLIGVLMIVLSGIQYSLSGGGEDAKKAKGRVIQLVAGLVLLFLTGMVLNTVAPWVYK